MTRNSTIHIAANKILLSSALERAGKKDKEKIYLALLIKTLDTLDIVDSSPEHIVDNLAKVSTSINIAEKYIETLSDHISKKALSISNKRDYLGAYLKTLYLIFGILSPEKLEDSSFLNSFKKFENNPISRESILEFLRIFTDKTLNLDLVFEKVLKERAKLVESILKSNLGGIPTHYFSSILPFQFFHDEIFRILVEEASSNHNFTSKILELFSKHYFNTNLNTGNEPNVYKIILAFLEEVLPEDPSVVVGRIKELTNIISLKLYFCLIILLISSLNYIVSNLLFKSFEKVLELAKGYISEEGFEEKVLDSDLFDKVTHRHVLRNYFDYLREAISGSSLPEKDINQFFDVKKIEENVKRKLSPTNTEIYILQQFLTDSFEFYRLSIQEKFFGKSTGSGEKRASKYHSLLSLLFLRGGFFPEEYRGPYRTLQSFFGYISKKSIYRAILEQKPTNLYEAVLKGISIIREQEGKDLSKNLEEFLGYLKNKNFFFEKVNVGTARGLLIFSVFKFIKAMSLKSFPIVLSELTGYHSIQTNNLVSVSKFKTYIEEKDPDNFSNKFLLVLLSYYIKYLMGFFDFSEPKEIEKLDLSKIVRKNFVSNLEKFVTSNRNILTKTRIPNKKSIFFTDIPNISNITRKFVNTLTPETYLFVLSNLKELTYYLALALSKREEKEINRREKQEVSSRYTRIETKSTVQKRVSYDTRVVSKFFTSPLGKNIEVSQSFSDFKFSEDIKQLFLNALGKVNKESPEENNSLLLDVSRKLGKSALILSSKFTSGDKDNFLSKFVSEARKFAEDPEKNYLTQLIPLEYFITLILGEGLYEVLYRKGVQNEIFSEEKVMAPFSNILLVFYSHLKSLLPKDLTDIFINLESERFLDGINYDLAENFSNYRIGLVIGDSILESSLKSVSELVRYLKSKRSLIKDIKISEEPYSLKLSPKQEVLISSLFETYPSLSILDILKIIQVVSSGFTVKNKNLDLTVLDTITNIFRNKNTKKLAEKYGNFLKPIFAAYSVVLNYICYSLLVNPRIEPKNLKLISSLEKFFGKSNSFIISLNNFIKDSSDLLRSHYSGKIRSNIQNLEDSSFNPEKLLNTLYLKSISYDLAKLFFKKIILDLALEEEVSYNITIPTSFVVKIPFPSDLTYFNLLEIITEDIQIEKPNESRIPYSKIRNKDIQYIKQILGDDSKKAKVILRVKNDIVDEPTKFSISKSKNSISLSFSGSTVQLSTEDVLNISLIDILRIIKDTTGSNIALRNISKNFYIFNNQFLSLEKLAEKKRDMDLGKYFKAKKIFENLSFSKNLYTKEIETSFLKKVAKSPSELFADIYDKLKEKYLPSNVEVKVDLDVMKDYFSLSHGITEDKKLKEKLDALLNSNLSKTELKSELEKLLSEFLDESELNAIADHYDFYFTLSYKEGKSDPIPLSNVKDLSSKEKIFNLVVLSNYEKSNLPENLSTNLIKTYEELIAKSLNNNFIKGSSSELPIGYIKFCIQKIIDSLKKSSFSKEDGFLQSFEEFSNFVSNYKNPINPYSDFIPTEFKEIFSVLYSLGYILEMVYVKAFEDYGNPSNELSDKFVEVSRLINDNLEESSFISKVFSLAKHLYSIPYVQSKSLRVLRTIRNNYIKDYMSGYTINSIERRFLSMVQYLIPTFSDFKALSEEGSVWKHITENSVSLNFDKNTKERPSLREIVKSLRRDTFNIIRVNTQYTISKVVRPLLESFILNNLTVYSNLDETLSLIFNQTKQSENIDKAKETLLKRPTSREIGRRSTFDVDDLII